jgi:hypothetical protein
MLQGQSPALTTPDIAGNWRRLSLPPNETAEHADEMSRFSRRHTFGGVTPRPECYELSGDEESDTDENDQAQDDIAKQDKDAESFEGTSISGSDIASEDRNGDDRKRELLESLPDGEAVPFHGQQSWEYPLSKSEKNMLYNQLCEQERVAVVKQYKRLVRRVSVSACKANCDDGATDSSDDANTREGDEKDIGEDDSSMEGVSEAERELIAKQKELERQLADVCAERKRVSLSRR